MHKFLIMTTAALGLGLSACGVQSTQLSRSSSKMASSAIPHFQTTGQRLYISTGFLAAENLIFCDKSSIMALCFAHQLISILHLYKEESHVMRILSALSIALVSSVIGFSALAETSHHDFSDWTCKTSPIWNGRASYPRTTSGATRDEAWQRAAKVCATSGQADYCRSAITCWEG
jgi:hypothetical protein